MPTLRLSFFSTICPFLLVSCSLTTLGFLSLLGVRENGGDGVVAIGEDHGVGSAVGDI